MDDIVIKQDDELDITICAEYPRFGKILYIQQDDNWERRFDSVTIYGPTKARELAAALNKAADELEKEE